MIADWTPMRWPAAWKSADALELLKGTPVNCLIGVDSNVAESARRAGLEVGIPAGVKVLEGVWPGIRMARFGASNAVSAGPTGEPWVNSNMWPVRLAQARKPGESVWIRANPANQQYATAIADAAITGGRWIISLEDALAAGLLQRTPEALAAWRKITSTAGYFAARLAWTDYRPEAVVGVVSAFATSQTQEVLNLITRSGQQYRVIPTEEFHAAALDGLRSVVIPDQGAPAPAVRSALTTFVRNGGQLIANKTWGSTDGAAVSGQTHPRFDLFSLGKGSLAISKSDFRDPYLLASDAAILVSHRYDLLRFWNAGAMSAYYSTTADRKRGLVQILFYANRPSEDCSIRINCPYRTAKLSTLDNPDPQPIHAEPQAGALEIHLPRVTQYAALELEN